MYIGGHNAGPFKHGTTLDDVVEHDKPSLTSSPTSLQQQCSRGAVSIYLSLGSSHSLRLCYTSSIAGVLASS
jgi:hypothetical protein